MNNLKEKIRPIVKYLRELSIIIVGVSITVGVGLWVNNNSIKKDKKKYFDAMILELKENAEIFDNYARELQRSVAYSNYINSHDEKSISRDSIDYYATGHAGWGSSISVILYNEDAFEMFKSSGAMRHVSDKNLLLSIWRVYHGMRSTQKFIDDCLEYKKEASQEDSQRFIAGEQIVVRVKSFYRNNLPQNMVYVCEDAAESIRETISELEKSKIVK